MGNDVIIYFGCGQKLDPARDNIWYGKKYSAVSPGKDWISVLKVYDSIALLKTDLGEGTGYVFIEDNGSENPSSYSFARDGVAFNKFYGEHCWGSAPIHKLFSPTAGDEPIINPERGFYSYEEFPNKSSYGYDQLFQKAREIGRTLVFVQAGLEKFKDSQINASFIEGLDKMFDDAEKAGVKIILRFAYHGGEDSFDPPIRLVTEHMGQLAPLFRKRAKLIASLQAGFAGKWGEWHNHPKDCKLVKDDDSRGELIRSLLGATMNTGIKVQFRKPAFVNECRQIAGEKNVSLCGMYDDCIGGTDTDMGTFEKSSNEYVAMKAGGPVGGETCRNGPETGCSEFESYSKFLGLSFLNGVGNQNVIDSWKENGCTGKIEQKLGYRLVLTDAWFPESLIAGNSGDIRLRIKNDGNAAPFNYKKLAFFLRDAAGTMIKIAEPKADVTGWDPQKESDVSAQFSIPKGTASGKYEIYLGILDANEKLAGNPLYRIRLANKDVWNEELGLNLLGEITVK